MDQIPSQDTLPKSYLLHWYEIRSLLGRGGYGITYLALDKNLERNVAIKEYLPIDFASRQLDHTVHPLTGEYSELYQWGLERFLKEARTLAKFNHPNIVRVLSVFEHNNTAYMIMEYEQGEDLSKLFKKRSNFSEEELLDIFIPILDGLSLVHKAGFIHRDIKPSNIYIRDDHSPVLNDFGSARQSSGRTRTLTSLVTYGYAPFEQYNEGHEIQGPWTDIYSFGASLYYGITRTKPEDALKRGGAILAGRLDPYVPVSVLAMSKYSENFLLAIDYALRFRVEDRAQDVLGWTAMLLGQRQAPCLPENFSKPKAVVENLDSTVIAPPGFFASPQQSIGLVKPSTHRLIDSSGRRVTGDKKTAAQTTDAIARSEKPKKSHSTALRMIGVLFSVLSIAAFVFVSNRSTKTNLVLAPTIVPQKEKLVDKETEKKTETINQWLKLAKTEFEAQHYVSPDGANAAYYYLQILELDRNNGAAAAGLDRITQHYADLVNHYFQNNEVLQAEANLQIIESIAPRSSVALGLRLKLQTVKGRIGKTVQLLNDADEDVKANKLTQPDDDNALDKYRQVLQIDSNNQNAKQGIQKIFDYYGDVVEKQITKGSTDNVVGIIEKMEIIYPSSVETIRLRKMVEKITDTSSQITHLLLQAKTAYQAGQFTQPSGSNALHYYQQVLKIDPGNAKAKYGIEEIVVNYKTQFDQAIQNDDLKKAEQVVMSLEGIMPNSSTTIGAMYKRLDDSKNPPKPEIETISDMVSRFKNSMEASDLQNIKNLSQFKPEREQFVDHFFMDYRAIKINISGFQYIANEHTAIVHASLTRLINLKGDIVQPGLWGEFDLVVKRNKYNQWRIFW